MLDTLFPLLLHSFVQDAPPEPDGLWNIPHLWRTAVEQNLLPVLAYENKRWKLFDDPNVCRQLDGLLYGTVATNLNRCVDFETLSASFTEHGIAHMPVKGYYLRKLYPTPELRTFGDIDLLIHPEDRQKVHNLMLSLGYTVKQDWEPTYSYIKDAEYYEIHTNLMDGNLDGRTDLQAYFDAAWAHAEPDDGLRFRPEKDEAPSRSRVLRKMLFPPAAEIESRYTFLRNRHWLLPLAWLVRLFANLRLIPSRICQMKQVTKTDKASVETYDGFMRRIGL